MLALIVAGVVLVVLTIMIHAGGTTLWASYLSRKYLRHGDHVSVKDRWFLSVFTAFWLLVLHFIEVLLWAVSLLLLPAVTQLQSLEQSLYFSLVTFTTLGYGDITLSPGVRLLSGVEAMNGILLFGWSTAFLFLVIQRAWQMSGSAAPPQD